jgi:hypothetical protein
MRGCLAASPLEVVFQLLLMQQLLSAGWICCHAQEMVNSKLEPHETWKSYF